MIFKPLMIVVLTSFITLLGFYAGFNGSQILSASIFSLFIFSTLLFWRFRLAFAFIGIVGLLITGVLDIPNLLKFANFDIILFLVGMMTAIGFLEKRKFFEYVMSRVLRIVGNRSKLLMATIIFMSGIFGAMVDEVTSILFMTSITLHLVARYKLKPIPFILMVVFGTNIGSSATVIGNPVGVLIAFKGGLSFSDFLRWATPISIVVLLLCILICMLYFSRDLKMLGDAMAADIKDKESESYKKHDIIVSVVYMLTTFPIIIFHKTIENVAGLEKNTMLLGAALLAAGIALFIDRKEAKVLFERSVDWWTLIFFALFFASVGTLKYVGTVDIIGKFMVDISGGSEEMLFWIFTAATAGLTPVVDNVLVVAVFIPVVESLSAMGLNNFPVWWGMLFAGTLFGNLTMIGSTANIVAVGMLESRGVEITLKDWIVAGAVVSVPTLLLAVLLLYVQFPYMPG